MRGVGVIEFGGPEALQVVDLPEVHANVSVSLIQLSEHPCLASFDREAL